MEKQMTVFKAVIALVVIITLSQTSYAQSGTDDIIGIWTKKGSNSLECDCGGCINIRFQKVIKFCIESNQIYLNVYYKLDRRLSRVYIFMHSVMEVGAGGAALPWDDFDKHQPLADIDVTNAKKGTVSVKWLGLRRKDNAEKVYPFGDGYAGTYERPVK